MPAHTQLYRQLLQTPLFQGMSRSDLEEVIGTTRFGFSHYAKGQTVASAGQPCRQLYFLLQGTISATTSASDHSFSMVEKFDAPHQLQPERLFGLRQYYSTTFAADTDCNFMLLDKSEIVRLLDQYLIFRLNFLNLLASRVHKLDDALWYNRQQTLADRILHFLLRHSLRPAGEKTMLIKMTRLAEILDTTRLRVSTELNALQDRGLLTLSRGKIHIPALERLFM